MSVDIDAIKRKLLIKYPTFGSVIANLEFQASKDIATAGTDGKVLLYNPKFVSGLSDKERTFLFAHEVCHVAFEHIFRSEGKDKQLWNIATDSVINALLKQDGLPMIDGGVDIPEAVNYDAEEMYNKLLEEKKKQQEQQSSQGNQQQQSSQGNQQQQNSQGNQQQQDSQGSQEQQSSQGNQEQQSSQGTQEQQSSQGSQEQQSSQSGQGQQNSQEQTEEQADVGHDTHSLWDKAIEERKKEQQEQAQQKAKKESKKTAKDKEKQDDTEQTEQQTNEFVEKGEKETFKQNKIERRKQLQELSKELAEQSSHEAGTGIQRQGKKLSDIGIATPLIDWRKFLRQAVKYDEEWTRKNARMRNGFFRHKVEEIPIPETEILLDTSGSVSETLLRNFLRECKNILANSKVKVGCFNTEFHGFTELRRVEDIDNMSFPIGGGTDFNVAVEAFSRRVPNKIIFTDGEAPMPEKAVRNVIWVVFGNQQINPRGGKVININGEQLRKLYRYMQEDKSANISR